MKQYVEFIECDSCLATIETKQQSIIICPHCGMENNVPFEKESLST